MVARKRKENESFKEYKDNLWDEEKEKRAYLQGFCGWDSRKLGIKTKRVSK